MEYLYLDRQRMLGYLEQANEPEAMNTIREAGFEAGIASLKASGKSVQRPRAWTDHEAASRVEHLLYMAKDIDYGRPPSHVDTQSASRMFVTEVTTVTKVVVPVPKDADLDLRELIFWSAEPYAEDYDPASPKWEAQGTFLLLIAHPSSADGGYSGTWSGKSALHALLEQCFPSEAGRFVHLNQKRAGPKPVEILRELGGIVLEPRRVKCVYKKRSISNELYYYVGEEERRSNLLIGYPLFIQEASFQLEAKVFQL